MDDDGLIAAGVPGVQLTWMDAKVGDWVVTPRIGKPVEVQALWINALHIGASRSPELGDLADRALASFRARFWNDGSLFDVVDVDHQHGRNDPSQRPNQIFAAGGLPLGLLEPDQAARVVETVERRLLTPMGLRSLAPGEPAYRGRYEGGVRERDGAYHQGTAWPWLIGTVRRGLAAAARLHAGGAARGRPALPRSAARPSRRRRPRPHLRDRRRRRAAHAARLPVPGLVAGRAPAVEPPDRGSDVDETQPEGRPRARPPRRGPSRRGPWKLLGPVPVGAAVGHGARGLQPVRHRLGLLSARSRALPRLSLGRGRHRRHLRRPASSSASRWRSGTARTRSSRSGCSA